MRIYFCASPKLKREEKGLVKLGEQTALPQNNYREVWVMSKNINTGFAILAVTLLLSSLSSSAPGVKLVTAAGSEKWQIHDMNRPQPPIVDPGAPSAQGLAGRPPSDAIVLFDGKDLSQWRSVKGGPAPWKVENGYMETVDGSGYIRSEKAFGDCQLHVDGERRYRHAAKVRVAATAGFTSWRSMRSRCSTLTRTRRIRMGRPAPFTGNIRRSSMHAGLPANGRPTTLFFAGRASTKMERSCTPPA